MERLFQARGWGGEAHSTRPGVPDDYLKHAPWKKKGSHSQESTDLVRKERGSLATVSQDALKRKKGGRDALGIGRSTQRRGGEASKPER